MRENTDQNNSEYGHFLRSENKNEVKTLKWRYFYVLAKFVKDAFYFAGIFQLHKYQLFAFINMSNLRKGQQNRCKLGSLKRLLYDKWPFESVSLSISVFWFFPYWHDFCQTFYKQATFFNTNFHGSSKVLISRKYFWSSNPW